MTETHENRLKRMRMRSWRRGIKEMDLILGGFADAQLAGLPAEVLDLYDALLAENDHDLYAWVTGRSPTPEAYQTLLGQIAKHANAPGPA